MYWNRVYDLWRAAYKDPEFINAWYKLVHNITAKYDITDSDFYDFDEISFIIGVIYGSLMVVTRVNR